jgi:hypothetical protein
MWYQDLQARDRRELIAAVRRLGAECARDYQARAHPAAPYYTMMSQRDERALVRLVHEYGVTDLDDIARIWHDAHAVFAAFWMGVRDEIRRQVAHGDSRHR